ncbi:hypothetical protein [Actinophytocola sediminis]
MTATPFALVSAADHDQVFAYGLDIDLPSGRDVVTFRRGPDGRTMFGVHKSVETARQRFSIVTPLELVWEPSCRCCLCVTGDESCDEDGACSSRLGR